MTREDAIKILNPATSFETLFGLTKEEGIKVVEEACLLAIADMEKQIPKKPVKVDSGVYDYPFDYECPNCRKNVDDFDHHCECGQTLLWVGNNK